MRAHMPAMSTARAEVNTCIAVMLPPLAIMCAKPRPPASAAMCEKWEPRSSTSVRGRGRDARARRSDQERVPNQQGAPSRSVDPSLRRGAVTTLSGACGASIGPEWC